MNIPDKQGLKKIITDKLNSIKIIDMHTHLYSPDFKELFLYGIDELLTYHYLVAETFRHNKELSYEYFWSLPKNKQADIVWETLFVQNTPVSEVCRSIITIFNMLGLDTNNNDLNYYREYFKTVNLNEHIDNVFRLSGIDWVVMTNDPFDNKERIVWEYEKNTDCRFKAALRLDVLLNTCQTAFGEMRKMGYDVHDSFDNTTLSEIKRFISEWIDIMDAMYCAVSLPPNFSMEDNSIRAEIIDKCVLPVCEEKNIPFALMIGVKRQVNPLLKLAGDSMAKADITSVEYLASKYPNNRFFLTMLNFENQHEMIVVSRKFKNVMPFGCWWFVNNPTTIDFITKLRVEMLGTSFIPQHSDCRVFEQLISKWVHSKKIIAEVLSEKYADLMDTGYLLSSEQIDRDLNKYFRDNFTSFC